MSYLSQTGLISPQADKALWSNCLRGVAASVLEATAKENFLKESRSWGLWLALALFSALFLFVGVRTGNYSAFFWFTLGAGFSALVCARHYFYEPYIVSTTIARAWFISRFMMLDSQSDANAIPAIGFRKTLADSTVSLVNQQFLRRALLHPSSKSFSVAH